MTDTGNPARMPRLLFSWALLAAIWAPGVLVVELLVLQRLQLTASALWTAALVPACQAVALESLAAPLGAGVALQRLVRSLRSARGWAPWATAAAGLGASWFGGETRVLSTTAALLALGAAGLFAWAARPSGPLQAALGSAAALVLVLLLAISLRIAPWLEHLPALIAPAGPPRAIRLLVLLPWLGGFYFTLFRVQRAVAGERKTAATWLAAAAAAGALALVVRFLPLRLDVAAPGTESLVPGTFLVLAAACLAAAETSLSRRGPED